MSNSLVSHKIMHSAFIAWLPIAVAILVFGGLLFFSMQQNYKLNANDPQAQIAQELITGATQGQDPATLVPPIGSTELGSSLAPFLFVANATGTVVGSSIIVDGKNPVIAESLLAYAKLKGENKLTWEPKKGVRAALVVMPYTSEADSGFVIVGRSLKEVDSRIKAQGIIIALGTLLALVLSYLVALYTTNKTHKVTHVEKITEIEIKS